MATPNTSARAAARLSVPGGQSHAPDMPDPLAASSSNGFPPIPAQADRATQSAGHVAHRHRLQASTPDYQNPAVPRLSGTTSQPLAIDRVQAYMQATQPGWEPRSSAARSASASAAASRLPAVVACPPASGGTAPPQAGSAGAAAAGQASANGSSSAATGSGMWEVSIATARHDRSLTGFCHATVKYSLYE